MNKKLVLMGLATMLKEPDSPFFGNQIQESCNFSGFKSKKVVKLNESNLKSGNIIKKENSVSNNLNIKESFEIKFFSGGSRLNNSNNIL